MGTEWQSLVRRRTLFVIFGVFAAAAMVLAAVALDSDRSGSVDAELASTPSVIRPGIAAGLEGMSLTSLGEAAEQVAPQVKLPERELVGTPVGVALVASYAENPNNPSKAEQGVMVQYEKGVVYSAQPLGDSSGPDFGASTKVHEDDALQWEDGRENAYDLTQVNGHDAMVQPGGIKTGVRFKERYLVNPAVIWVEDGVEYSLESESLSAAELLVIAEGISQQR